MPRMSKGLAAYAVDCPDEAGLAGVDDEGG